MSSFSTENRADEEMRERRAALRRIESDLVILESDERKIAKRLDSEKEILRNMQKQLALLSVQIKEKQQLVEKLEREHEFKEEELKSLKRKRNAL
jgi:chromosome segregation ATPase